MNGELLLRNFFPNNHDFGALSTLLSQSTYVGIDFGTSTTVVSFAKIDEQGKFLSTEVMPLKQPTIDGGFIEDHIVPSVLAWYNDTLFWGKDAKKLKTKLSPGKNVWSSFKMNLGVDEGPVYFNSELAKGLNNVQILNPIDVTKHFFTLLRKAIDQFISENKLPSRIKYCITVPASFESNQRNDLKKALEFAGIHTDEKYFIDEPNSAFISFISDSFASTSDVFFVPPSTPIDILVFDFGAGTCDVTILEILNTNGKLTSRNLSISKFEALGGDDVDRQIVEKHLYPQFLEQNNIHKNEIKSPQYLKSILPKLQSVAELIKINLCHNVSANMIGHELPKLALSNEKVEKKGSINFHLMRESKSLINPSLTYKSFSDLVLKLFDNGYSNLAGQTISIKSILNQALTKAGIKHELIDIVLLIGGSSKNPYIQRELRRFFPEAEIAIPRDLQAHVSQGAALNALMIHGLGVDILTPIISEPIFIILGDQRVKTIVTAGTAIPSLKIKSGSLYPNRDGQEDIEIPICVSNVDKILTILRIKGHFKRNEEILVECDITHDKLLHFRAILGNLVVESEPLNPLANAALSTEQLVEKKIRKKLNESALRNNGVPSVKLLEELARHYADTKQHLKAAELFESIYELTKSPETCNYICYHYSFAGRMEKQIEWAKKAYELQPSGVNAFNYALIVNKKTETELYHQLMREAINNGVDIAKVIYGEYLKNNDNPEGQTLLQDAFEDLYARYKGSYLHESSYRTLIRVSELLEKFDVSREVLSSLNEKEKNQSNIWFNKDNLLIDTTTAIIKGD